MIKFFLNSFKYVLKSGIILLLVHSVLFAQQADFAIFFSPEDNAACNELSAVITKNSNVNVLNCRNVQEVLSSNAKVLVLFMDYEEDKNFSDEQLENLKGYKIIGIDIGSAQLFNRLGLEIGSNFIHDYDNLTPKIHPVKNPLLEVSGYKKNIPVFELISNENPLDKNINFAMFIPPKSHFRKYVDVIATWNRGIYAPIVKQSNYLTVGLAAPVSTWTQEYKAYFQAVAMAMLQQPAKPFATAKWELTDPGDFSFKLANDGNKKELFDKTFYFKFKSPTNLKVHLDHKNTKHITLVFYGKNGENWTRLDSEDGSTINLDTKINQNEINRIQNGYWRLDITNFDRKHPALCEMKIEY